jgi:hypothetical protein
MVDGKVVYNNRQFEKTTDVDPLLIEKEENYTGPSFKEREEKRIADSIRVADSLAMVMAKMQRNAN